MRIGCCIGMTDEKTMRILKGIGYEYIETGLWEGYAADEAKMNAYLEALDKVGLKCEVSAYAFPGVYNPAGEQTREELEIAREKFHDVIAKTRAMGNTILVVGAGGVRNFPTDKGYDIANVYEQLAVVCREVISPVLAQYGMTAALEGLNKGESPTFNLTEQSVDTAKKSGRDNIRVMTDYYHIFLEKEDMSKFRDFGDMIVHAHIANPVGRVMPAPGDGADYPSFFNALKSAGFNARLSVEAGIQGEFEKTMTDAFIEMKKYAW